MIDRPSCPATAGAVVPFLSAPVTVPRCEAEANRPVVITPQPPLAAATCDLVLSDSTFPLCPATATHAVVLLRVAPVISPRCCIAEANWPVVIPPWPFALAVAVCALVFSDSTGCLSISPVACAAAAVRALVFGDSSGCLSISASRLL